MEDFSRTPVSELRKLFLAAVASLPPDEIINALENDSRAGARQIALMIRRRRENELEENARLENLLCFEKTLWSEGFRNIAGVDEAGIGPLAGPVVAAAVILPQGCKIRGLDDSKKISRPGERERLEERIKNEAQCWAVGRAEAEEIDSLNIYHAGILAMRRAVERLSAKPDYLLVDARVIPGCACPQRGVIHGDALSMSIAAASILAKTCRDRVMLEIDALYPGYGFSAHKGYPTPEHIGALQKLGPSPVHRRSYAPVKKYCG
ncbi:MAG: ribonuclease HII [Acidobacteriota bacterium]|jgi:ribonuclease HII|nr:ribonuclease HII [Acidobacteriota bacterium]